MIIVDKLLDYTGCIGFLRAMPARQGDSSDTLTIQIYATTVTQVKIRHDWQLFNNR